MSHAHAHDAVLLEQAQVPDRAIRVEVAGPNRHPGALQTTCNLRRVRAVDRKCDGRGATIRIGFDRTEDADAPAIAEEVEQAARQLFLVCLNEIEDIGKPGRGVSAGFLLMMSQ